MFLIGSTTYLFCSKSLCLFLFAVVSFDSNIFEQTGVHQIKLMDTTVYCHCLLSSSQDPSNCLLECEWKFPRISGFYMKKITCFRTDWLLKNILFTLQNIIISENKRIYIIISIYLSKQIIDSNRSSGCGTESLVDFKLSERSSLYFFVLSVNKLLEDWEPT